MYKIELKYEGNQITIEMKHRLSVLSDNSGVGKTYIAKAICSASRVKRYGTISSTIEGKNCEVYVIFEDTKIDEIEDFINKENSIIIIDEADKIICTNPKLIKNILENKKSGYLLILRGDPEGLVIGPKQYLTFSQNKNEIEVKPYVSNVNNFFQRGVNNEIHLV